MRSSGASDEAARELILRHGWNSTVYQILNPDMHHWFAPGGGALVGYVEHAGVRVMAGAPVAELGQLDEVAAEFEEDGRRRSLATCYFAVEPRWLERVGRRGSVALVGAQPVWDAAEWAETTGSHASLRAQFNRARNKGVTVEARPLSSLAPGSPDSSGLTGLRRRWLDAKGLPPLGFLTGVEILPAGAEAGPALTRDRRLYVASRESEALGYLVASPIPLRNGWLIEQVIRHPRAPNGTAELLIDTAARDLAAAGARRLTLGLSPLSRKHRPPPAQCPHTPPWLQLAFGWAHAHGRRFYDFAGLESFKEKFRPRSWEGVYLVVSEPRIGLRSLYSVAAAFTDGRPLAALASGVRRAYWRGVGAG